MKSFRRPQGRSIAESGVGKAGPGDADSPAARCPKERSSSTVRSAAELHSGDARRVAGTAGRRVKRRAGCQCRLIG